MEFRIIELKRWRSIDLLETEDLPGGIPGRDSPVFLSEPTSQKHYSQFPGKNFLEHSPLLQEDSSPSP